VEGDDVDHVLHRVLPDGVASDAATSFADPEPNPFLRYRRFFHAYQVGRARGLSDEDYVGLVRDLDEAVARVDGRGFRATPFSPSEILARGLGLSNAGAAWVKDETRNVSGSHKARHLMGILLWLRVMERVGAGPERAAADRDLAIASCGNAALAAAVVAKAAGRRLRVFVPPDADPAVLARLADLGAHLTSCPREEGVAGDPCYHRFREAVAEGALPFTCQGNENGLTLDGGRTLGYEMASVLAGEGRTLDRLFVQVGGGALATSVWEGLEEAHRWGVLPSLPRLHAVQTQGAAPLARAFDRVRRDLGDRTNDPAQQEKALRHAATHRSRYMWPWEATPRSLATGILDDETYDWLAVVRAMLRSGGSPVVVPEETVREAHHLAETSTGIPVDPTGSAGLAGLLHLQREGAIDADEALGLLFTGVRR
jgi:threonine synthase